MGRTNGHRECEKRVKTKRAENKGQSVMIRTSFSSLYPRPIPHFPRCVSTTCDADVAERREHFSLLCRVRYLSLSFSQTPRRFSCLISQLVLRNTHCWFCSNHAAGDLRRFLSQLVFVSRFCADNARFLGERKRERKRDAIRNNCALPYQPRDSRLSAEKNPVCSEPWQR